MKRLAHPVSVLLGDVGRMRPAGGGAQTVQAVGERRVAREPPHHRALAAPLLEERAALRVVAGAPRGRLLRAAVVARGGRLRELLRNQRVSLLVGQRLGVGVGSGRISIELDLL